MTSLNEIEEYLNEDFGILKLRDGKINPHKNRYYWIRHKYFIIELNEDSDKWIIASANKHTRELLNMYIIREFNGYGSTKTNVYLYLHRLLMKCEMRGFVVDHINRQRFDNRIENLRVVTHKQNMRNRSIAKNNTTGKTGVSKVVKITDVKYYARISTDDGKISKTFSVNKYGNDEAFRMAVEWRISKEIEFGYN